MSRDFWSEYFSRKPNDGISSFESDDFEKDVARMMGEDEDWEDVPMEEHK